MAEKYTQNICSCGCSTITIPNGIESSQLYLNCLVNPEQKYIKATIKWEEKRNMHGWKKIIRGDDGQHLNSTEQ
jgi:hypothetical protein